jgi:drug/metabolite transporter (DMT)-like permease
MSVAIPKQGLRHVPVKGLLYMIGGVFFLSVMDASAKWLTTGYSVSELMFLGRLPAPLFAMALAMANGGLVTLKTRKVKWHLARALSGIATMATFFYALKLLPLADTIAISFVAPLFMCALSVPLLKEKVGPRRWAAILLGFAGVIVIVQPGGAGLGLGAVLALTAAFTYAISINLSRKISTTETSYSMLFWFSVFLLIGSGTVVPFQWVTPHGSDIAVFCIMAVGGTLGQFLLTQAYRYGEISFLAPLEYTALIWAVLFGFLFWNQFPNAVVLTGSLIIVASNIYIVHRETKLHGQKTDPASAAAHVPEP